MKKLLTFFAILFAYHTQAQTSDSSRVLPPVKPVKISHAEPLYLDLVRDLGARKGEREWNVGTSFSKHGGAAHWHPFVEYEFAPINRLGLEVEVPLQAQVPMADDIPSSSLNMKSLKTSLQWTYAVIEPWQTSLAVGYTNELLINHESGKLFSAELGFPFMVAAKKWGSQVHTLVYAALGGEKKWGKSLEPTGYEVNLALHYVIPHSKAFVGVELYHSQNGPVYENAIRPQVRVALKNNLLVGFVSSFSLKNSDPVSSFIRIIYEPKKRK
ncbi:HAEPLYID family protein [Siphonobacter sp. SORGH_AS_1065]|uniref:HAEPLYID family protein n=1 Tax=Siphonobacter sp. SORGH_AS_1065 TaxID=3041795 RepID=UPI00278411FC|nr:HAEPLYID family protein [Siphonobacter sp. SORGH_AS_1065]MDQ1086056.1 hypothetical protein [Siphonobacter sp. SORGH_AS_1065]